MALLLFSVGGLFSIYEGWHKLENPEALHQAWVALVVLAISIGLEVASTIGCLNEIRKLRGRQSLAGWLKKTRNAELVVVLGEDVAALLGLVVAFCFVSLAAATGDPVYDAIGSICIGVILVMISLLVARRMKSLIVGRSPEPEVRRLIQEFIAEDDAIDTVYNTITMQFGSSVMLAAKVGLRPDVSLRHAIARINSLEQRIKAEFPEIAWCFVEPDIAD